VLEVDVGDNLRKIPALTPILDPEVFARAHIAEGGGGIEWFDTEFGADNLYAWAKEQAGEVSHEMFGEWMQRNELSLTTTAVALGISRPHGELLSHRAQSHSTLHLACLSRLGSYSPEGENAPTHLANGTRIRGIKINFP